MNRLMLGLLAAIVALALPALAQAQDDPPGRVARLSDIQGGVSWYDGERGEWVPAVRNRPLTTGDRLSADHGARAELRIGSTTLRLGGPGELEILRLDDDRVRVQLHSGSLALRVRSRDVADEVEVVTTEARLRPLRAGHYRIDHQDDTSWASALRGELRINDGEDPFTIDSGRRAELWREDGRLQRKWVAVLNDDFGDWVARADRADERTAAYRYVSPEMTGAEDLDRHGRWDQHPDYGPVWTPVAVAPDWAPYRYGHWAWVGPWGWTWVDDAPWGFAPFHYGRWVYWRDRWCWTPGSYVARPVYAPALVAWVGGPHLSVSVRIGAPAVGWLPLAPREVFVPWYRATPRYEDRVNHRRPGYGEPRPVPTGPIMYGNQGVPNAVTVVPRDVLQNRQPVGRAVIDVREPIRQPLPVLREAPAPAPVMAQPAPVVRPAPPVRVVPGGAEPVRPPRAEAPREVPLPRRDSGDDGIRRGGPDRPAQPPAVVDLRRNHDRDRAAPVQPASPPVQQAPQPAPQAPQPAPVQALPPRPVQAVPQPQPPVAVVPAPQQRIQPAPGAQHREGRAEERRAEGKPNNEGRPPRENNNARERENVR